MSGRVERLQRLASIRSLTEELDRNALQTALLAVSAVECAITAIDAERAESQLIARAELSVGNRSEWIMADAEGEVAGWNRSKLKRLLSVRTETAGAAMERFLKSRCEHEQVKQLVKDTHQAQLLDEVRRMQVSADDWFLNKRMPEDM